MLVVKPKVELWLQGNGLSSFVAQCARVCYASDKGDDNRLVHIETSIYNDISDLIIIGQKQAFKIVDKYIDKLLKQD